MQTPFDLGMAFLEIFVASVMLLVILTATGQSERLLQTQTAYVQQIDTQRQTSDLRRFHQTQIPYYEVMGAIHTHSKYDFPVIVTSEDKWVNSSFRYVDQFVAEIRDNADTIPSIGSGQLFFVSTPKNTTEVNNTIRGLSSTLRFNARVLYDGSGMPVALLFTY